MRRRLAAVALLLGWHCFPATEAIEARTAARPPGPAARHLLREQRVGVLATQSAALPGYPFASLTPYALDARGRPLILISTLSQHTHNIRADARVSLLVYDTTHPDIHDAARLTWIGRATPVPTEDARGMASYLRRFPEARRFLRAHDFKLYAIEPARGYYIGGFGRIFWVEPVDLLAR